MTAKKTQEKSYEDKINKLKLVHYISVEMNKAHDTQELLELILERCLELTGAKTGSVMLLDDEEQVLDIIAFKGLSNTVVENTKLKIGEGVTGWVARTGTPKLINDTQQDPLYVKVKEDLLSEIAVPIKTEKKLIGVVSIDSNKRNAFSQDDLELLTMVSELAAQIIVRDEMEETLRSKLMLQETLISVFDVIEQKEELTDIFNGIMDTLKDKMGVLRGILVLFDSGDPAALKVRAGYKISEEAIKKGIYKIGEGVIGTAVLKGQTIGIEDVMKDTLFMNKMKIHRAGQGRISFIAAPIKAGTRVIGVIAVEKKYEDGESFEDVVDTLTILASMLAYRVRSHQRQEEQTKKLITENIELRRELKTESSFKNIIGKNEKLRNVMEQVKIVANTAAPVLINGETGTGKELFAKVLHFLSDRQDKNFVSVNCAAIPENLLESELFGYVKGAFTGAAGKKRGKFEIAGGGTLFLDEIGEIPLHLQTKLLRAIQEKEIEPLGSEETVKVDIRIVAATNRDLKKMVDEGLFRADLFFRLNVIAIELPPLRERKDDMPLLVDFFIKRYNKLYEKKITGIKEDVERLFMDYDWPGNIRELENVMERGVIMSRGSVIDASLIPESLKIQKEKRNEEFSLKNYIEKGIERSSDKNIYKEVMGEVEKTLIEEALIRTDYNKSKTAEDLGINRNTLKSKMKDYGLM
ncbi:MAG: sigma 54-interacting transcriptional regulator [Candidatus Goldiibacteriota bacterium]